MYVYGLERTAIFVWTNKNRENKASRWVSFVTNACVASLGNRFIVADYEQTREYDEKP